MVVIPPNSVSSEMGILSVKVLRSGVGRSDGRGFPQESGNEGRASKTCVPVQQEQEGSMQGVPVALGPLQDGKGLPRSGATGRLCFFI